MNFDLPASFGAHKARASEPQDNSIADIIVIDIPRDQKDDLQNKIVNLCQKNIGNIKLIGTAEITPSRFDESGRAVDVGLTFEFTPTVGGSRKEKFTSILKKLGANL